MSSCTVDAETITSTSLQCTLAKEPTCGDYIPTVTTVKGNIAVAEAVSARTITSTITAVEPETALNLLGNDNITFTGTNFPHELDTSTFEIYFTDE